jgi:hypothetical protein
MWVISNKKQYIFFEKVDIIAAVLDAKIILFVPANLYRDLGIKYT